MDTEASGTFQPQETKAVATTTGISLPGMYAQEGKTANATLEVAAPSSSGNSSSRRCTNAPSIHAKRRKTEHSARPLLSETIIISDDEEDVLHIEGHKISKDIRAVFASSPMSSRLPILPQALSQKSSTLITMHRHVEKGPLIGRLL